MFFSRSLWKASVKPPEKWRQGYTLENIRTRRQVNINFITGRGNKKDFQMSDGKIWTLDEARNVFRHVPAKKSKSRATQFASVDLLNIDQLLDIMLTTEDIERYLEAVDAFNRKFEEEANYEMVPFLLYRKSVDVRQAIREIDSTNKNMWLIKMPISTLELTAILDHAYEFACDIYKGPDKQKMMLLIRGTGFETATKFGGAFSFKDIIVASFKRGHVHPRNTHSTPTLESPIGSDEGEDFVLVYMVNNDAIEISVRDPNGEYDTYNSPKNVIRELIKLDIIQSTQPQVPGGFGKKNQSETSI